MRGRRGGEAPPLNGMVRNCHFSNLNIDTFVKHPCKTCRKAMTLGPPPLGEAW